MGPSRISHRAGRSPCFDYLFLEEGRLCRTIKVVCSIAFSRYSGQSDGPTSAGFWLEAYKGAGFWERLGQGYVVDFLDFKLPLYDKIMPSSGGHWPAFNVADSCISIAAALLFLTAILEAKKEMTAKKAAKKA